MLQNLYHDFVQHCRIHDIVRVHSTRLILYHNADSGIDSHGHGYGYSYSYSYSNSNSNPNFGSSTSDGMYILSNDDFRMALVFSTKAIGDGAVLT